MCVTLHHLGSLENKQKFINEVERILQRGGVFILNHCDAFRIDSLWYIAENERVKHEMREKVGTRSELLTLADNAGLEFKEEIPIFDSFLQSDEILVSKEGRSGASLLGLFTEEERGVFYGSMEERVKKG